MWKAMPSPLRELFVFFSCLSSALSLGVDTTCQFKPDGLYRHGTSCKRFIHCAHGRPFYKVCPIFMEFNERTKACDIPANAKCNVRMASAKKFAGGNEECKNQQYSVFGVPNDCRSYFICMNGKKIKKKCPPGLRYHLKYKVCVYGKATDCLQSPFCTGRPDGTYNHPKTCQSYIFCVSGVTVVKNCPPLMVFDAIKRRCAWKWSSFCAVESAKDPSKDVTQVFQGREAKATEVPTIEYNNFSPPQKTVTSPNEVRWKEIGVDEESISTEKTIAPSTSSNFTTPGTQTNKPVAQATPISPLDFLRGLNFAMLRKNVGGLHKQTSMETYVISGQGYPAVPVQDQRYELMNRLKNVRITVHGLGKSQAMMKKENFNAPVKVLDVSYETNTLPPVVAAKETGDKDGDRKPKLKTRTEFKQFIRSMNEQVKQFSNQMKKASHTEGSFNKAAMKGIAPALQNRKVLSRLLKDFLRGRLKGIKATSLERHPQAEKTKHPWHRQQRRQDKSPKTPLFHSKPSPRPPASQERAKAARETARRLENQQQHFIKETTSDRLNPRLPVLKKREGLVVSSDLRGLQRNSSLRQRSQELQASSQTDSIEPEVPQRLMRSSQVQRESRRNKKTDLALNSRKRSREKPPSLQSKLNSICSNVFDPVCGSDLQTYFNDCHLALTSCSRDKSNLLKKLHEGPCQTKL